MKTNQIKLSELKELKIGESITFENEIGKYGFTKQNIFDTEHLIFGFTGDCWNVEIMPINEYTDNRDYKEIQEKINDNWDIKLEIVFDINIEE